jgi:hypothetical protein
VARQPLPIFRLVTLIEGRLARTPCLHQVLCPGTCLRGAAPGLVGRKPGDLPISLGSPGYFAGKILSLLLKRSVDVH